MEIEWECAVIKKLEISFEMQAMPLGRDIEQVQCNEQL